MAKRPRIFETLTKEISDGIMQDHLASLMYAFGGVNDDKDIRAIRLIDIHDGKWVLEIDTKKKGVGILKK